MQKIVALLTMLLLSTLCFGDFSELQILFPNIDYESLALIQTQGSATRFYTPEEGAQWIPDTDTTRDIITPWSDFTLGAESIFVIKTYDVGNGIVDLHNALRSVSALEGVEYFSVSRNKMRILFEESWAIDDLESKKPIEDPLVSSVPLSDQSVFVAQKDNTFGKSISKITYRADSLGFSMENITRLYYTFISVVAPGNLKVDIIVVPTGDNLVFYGAMRMRSPAMAIMESRMKSSIENRIIALFNWFAISIGAPVTNQVSL